MGGGGISAHQPQKLLNITGTDAMLFMKMDSVYENKNLLAVWTSD